MAPTFSRALLQGAALVSVCSGMTLKTVAVPSVAGPGEGQEPLRFGGSRSDASRRVKTMKVEGHTVSQVSARWTGKVVYAIFTSAIESYHNKLLAELDSWAARPAAEGRYVAVGGSNYPEEWQTENVLMSECGDRMSSISCKEASLLAEGAARGADWLVVTGEDNYVHTKNVEEALASKDPDEAVAYGVIGCGKGMGFCNEDPKFATEGGFCGGTGYIISRAALQKLFVDGAQALHKIYDATRAPNDMTTSCQLRLHGAELRWLDGMFGYPIIKIEDYEDMANRYFLTTHYVQPAVMRWLHEKIEGPPAGLQGDSPARTKRLEDDAFEDGCAIGMNTPYWHEDYVKCQSVHGRTRAVVGN